MNNEEPHSDTLFMVSAYILCAPRYHQYGEFKSFQTVKSISLGFEYIIIEHTEVLLLKLKFDISEMVRIPNNFPREDGTLYSKVISISRANAKTIPDDILYSTILSLRE